MTQDPPGGAIDDGLHIDEGGVKHGLESRVHAAAFVVALIREGFTSEAWEFVEWYLETFDFDLQEILDA